jgi:hypothetical protein
LRVVAVVVHKVLAELVVAVARVGIAYLLGFLYLVEQAQP